MLRSVRCSMCGRCPPITTTVRAPSETVPASLECQATPPGIESCDHFLRVTAASSCDTTCNTTQHSQGVGQGVTWGCHEETGAGSSWKLDKIESQSGCFVWGDRGAHRERCTTQTKSTTRRHVSRFCLLCSKSLHRPHTRPRDHNIRSLVETLNAN